MRSRTPAIGDEGELSPIARSCVALDPKVKTRARSTHARFAGKSDFAYFGARREAGTREPSIS